MLDKTPIQFSKIFRKTLPVSRHELRASGNTHAAFKLETRNSKPEAFS